METTESVQLSTKLSSEAVKMVQDLQKRYNRSVYPYSCANKRGKQWTLEEDSIIVHAAAIQSSKSWAAIALALQESWPGTYYTPKQVRERWCNHLNPNVNKGQWSLSEDVALLEFVVDQGRQWSIAGKLLQGRTEHNIKNRYKSMQKRAKRDYGTRVNREELLLDQLRLELESGSETNTSPNVKAAVVTQPEPADVTQSQVNASVVATMIPIQPIEIPYAMCVEEPISIGMSPPAYYQEDISFPDICYLNDNKQRCGFEQLSIDTTLASITYELGSPGLQLEPYSPSELFAN